MSIIVATDFSETAARAMEIGAAMARRAGDRITLVHATEPPASSPLALATDARVLEQALREQATAGLQAEAQALRGRGLQVEERLARGEPAPIIAALGRELDARLIVLGSHGRRAVTRLLLGSVAQETLLLADRPLLVARGQTDTTAFEAWARGERHLKVVFAVDRSRATSAAAAWVRWLRGLGGVDVEVIHVFDPLVETVRRDLRATEEPRGELEPMLERELAGFVGELPGDGAVTRSLRRSTTRPGEVVAERAEEMRADLLVLGTHQRTRIPRIWLGSTAELALRHARLPVVCVPAPQASA